MFFLIPIQECNISPQNFECPQEEKNINILDVEESENTLMKLISNEYPIIPRVVDGKINIDLRSVLENQDNKIAEFLNSL